MARAGILTSSDSITSHQILNKCPIRKIERDPVKISDYTNINVAGRNYLIKDTALEKFPNTLLGSSDKEQFWREELKAYYFDRNREAFIAVQQFYQSNGQYSMPHSVSRDVVLKELNFYRISQELEDKESDGFELTQVATDDPNFREKIYMLLNFPKTSTSANVIAWTDCFIILLSISLLIIESEPSFKKYFSDNDEVAFKYAFGANCIIMAYFTMDYFMRLFSHPAKVEFFKLYLPWLDILSVMPFYVEVVMMIMEKRAAAEGGGEGHEEEIGHHAGQQSEAYVMLRVCRIFRVARVFKLVRRCDSLLVLIKALSKTKNEMVLLAGIVSMTSLVLGSVMYLVESENNQDYNSILMSCWWSVITITTVGYGDMVPKSFMGMICGSVAVFIALVLIALPATIIVTKFSEEYEKTNQKSSEREQQEESRAASRASVANSSHPSQ